jgi:CheY-like chemotaxis protein
MTLTGTRILVVEDEGMIAMLMKGMLESIGCEVVGVAGRLPDALAKIGTLIFDVALLDINLAGTLSYPAADELLSRGTPFIFTSSYGKAALPTEMQDAPLLSKPFMTEQLAAALGKLRNGPWNQRLH